MELHVIKREGRETVVLLDNEMRIVKPVYDYLKFQRQKDKALNTLKASGSDLRTYWEFLNDSGYEYDKVTPKMIAEFIDYLRASDDDVIALNKESKRTNKTINRILSTIHMFYQFEADMQEIDNPILMHDVNRPFNAFKGIMEHAKSDNKTKQSIFKVKESDYKMNLVTDGEMELFLSRLDKRRDILLYKMLYLTGARIQEVLDLEIDSVPLPDMSQLVGCFRQIKSKGTLMIWRVPQGRGTGSVSVITTQTFSQNWFRDFIEYNNIKDAYGDYYNLTSHQFRRSPLDDVVAVKKDKIQLKDDKIASLREQVKKLEDDKKKLIVQLVDYEELKSENERLKKQLAKK